jgi:hypothetical protein
MPELHLPAPYPLAWPEGRQRTARRVTGTYSVRGYAEAMSSLEREIGRWSGTMRDARITDWQLTSTHVGRARASTSDGDPGAALWFVLGGKTITAGANLMVIACDKFADLPHNIRALELTMSRLRLVDEIGAYSLVQAVEGARALPPPDPVVDWRAELGLAPGPHNLQDVQDVYRIRARRAGEGSPLLKTLNLAIDAARKELST